MVKGVSPYKRRHPSGWSTMQAKSLQFRASRNDAVTQEPIMGWEILTYLTGGAENGSYQTAER